MGLSLGSIKKGSTRPCDFSQDLTPFSLMVVAAVALYGRTRDLPSTLDASLSLPKLDRSTRNSLFALPSGSALAKTANEGGVPAPAPFHIAQGSPGHPPARSQLRAPLLCPPDAAADADPGPPPPPPPPSVAAPPPFDDDGGPPPLARSDTSLSDTVAL